MLNIFDSLTNYGSWNKKSERNFNEQELSTVSSAMVVESNYGLSVCFLMKQGGRSYIPLSPMSKLESGAQVDLNTAKIITLEKPGERDIIKVEA